MLLNVLEWQKKTLAEGAVNCKDSRGVSPNDAGSTSGFGLERSQDIPVDCAS